jgi:hypothetical protein
MANWHSQSSYSRLLLKKIANQFSIQRSKPGSTESSITSGRLLPFFSEFSSPIPAMETTLHQDLKTRYGGEDNQFEVVLGN